MGEAQYLLDQRCVHFHDLSATKEEHKELVFEVETIKQQICHYLI